MTGKVGEGSGAAPCRLARPRCRKVRVGRSREPASRFSAVVPCRALRSGAVSESGKPGQPPGSGAAGPLGRQRLGWRDSVGGSRWEGLAGPKATLPLRELPRKVTREGAGRNRRARSCEPRCRSPRKCRSRVARSAGKSGEAREFEAGVSVPPFAKEASGPIAISKPAVLRRPPRVPLRAHTLNRRDRGHRHGGGAGGGSLEEAASPSRQRREERAFSTV